MQEECDEGIVDALLRIIEAIINVFRMFNWVTEKGWLRIPRIWSEGDVIEETNSSNITNEIFRRKLFKLFLQSHECIKINIYLNLPQTTTTLIMNISWRYPCKLLRIYLPKYHDNEDLILNIQ